MTDHHVGAKHPPVHHATARKLATATEWDLLSKSYSRAVTHKALTPARLRQMIARAQRLHDKYRDRNAPVKQAMFADAALRFAARLEQLTPTLGERLSHGADERPPRESSAVVPEELRVTDEPWLAPPAEGGSEERVASEASRAEQQRLKLSHQSAASHQGHVGSRTRHRQAARDAR